MGNWLARESEAPYGATSRDLDESPPPCFWSSVWLIAALTADTLAIISHPPPPGVGLADLLNKNPDAYVLSLGHFLDLTGSAMSLFRGPLIGTSLAFFFGAGGNWFLRRRGSARGSANWVLALMMIAVHPVCSCGTRRICSGSRIEAAG